jgi:dihydroflavonol-4-reductase
VQVLVTGATGFLGRHLVPLLVERGDPVRAFVRDGTDGSWLRALDVDVRRGSLTDADALRESAAGCGLVFNLAGVVSHEAKDLPRLRAANIDGARAVAEAVEAGTRLVHVSSNAAVGPTDSPERPADEEHPFPEVARRLPYAATKRAGEDAVLATAGTRRVEAVVANPGFLLGPGDVYRISTWPVQRYLQGFMRVHAPGGLNYVDARDVAAGLLALPDRGRPGERYLLTHPDGNLSHAAFYRRLGDVTGARRVMVGLPLALAPHAVRLAPWPVKPGEAKAAVHWWFHTCAKAERELGFATRPLEETLAETASYVMGT